jgi:peptide/nickel transport system substrate-binding protein
MTDFDDFNPSVKSGLDRRGFIIGSAATGAAVFATCATLPRRVLSATPSYGGRIRVGMAHGSTTDSLDPATIGQNGFLGVLSNSFHNHLFDVDESGALKGELVESWEGSDDAAQWVIKLRKGVEFHNGKTMTADDVVASLNYHRSEESKSAAKSYLDDLAEMKIDGPNTVVFTLKEGYADFPYILMDQHFVILPSEGGKTDWTNNQASGPFMVKDYEPGVRAFLVKNPNYYKNGRPYFDELELLTIADSSARMNALITGEVDLIDRVELKTVGLLSKNPDVSIKETQGDLHYTLPMHSDTVPFDDNDVRLALKYAIDREQLVKTILSGHGSVGNDHPIGTNNAYHASDLEQRQYDPDKAKFHLKKAGQENLSVSIHLADAAFAGAIDAGVLYREHAAKAGIDLKVVREPNDGYWSGVWLKKPWCASYWLGRASAYAMLSVAYSAGADWNESHFNNATFEKLLPEVKVEVDEVRKKELYFELQRIINEEGGSVIPMFGNYVFAASNKLAHGDLRGDRDLDGQKFCERWWFA